MELFRQNFVDANCSLVIMSAGSFEQHGPHLPVCTDSVIARAVAKKLAKRLGACMGPSFDLGISPEHMGFAATISLSEETFISQIDQAAKCLKAHGAKRIILINGHGGNNHAVSKLDPSIESVNLTCFLTRYDHAGEVETSLMMHICPELVRKDRIRRHDFRWPPKDGWDDTRLYSESGVFGDPTKASESKGKRFLSELVKASIKKLNQK